MAKGVVNAIALPHAMRYDAPVTGSRRSTLLEALGALDAPSEPSHVLAAFLKTLDTAKSLREIGLSQEV